MFETFSCAFPSGVKVYRETLHNKQEVLKKYLALFRTQLKDNITLKAVPFIAKVDPHERDALKDCIDEIKKFFEKRHYLNVEVRLGIKLDQYDREVNHLSILLDLPVPEPKRKSPWDPSRITNLVKPAKVDPVDSPSFILIPPTSDSFSGSILTDLRPSLSPILNAPDSPTWDMCGLKSHMESSKETTEETTDKAKQEQEVKLESEPEPNRGPDPEPEQSGVGAKDPLWTHEKLISSQGFHSLKFTVGEEWSEYFPANYPEHQTETFFYFCEQKKFPPSEMKKISEIITDFLKEHSDEKFMRGSKVDALDGMNKWYSSTIQDVNSTYVLIHFDGWGNKWNEWIHCCSPRLARLNTHQSGVIGPLGNYNEPKTTSEIFS